MMVALYEWIVGVLRGIYGRRISGPPILPLEQFFPNGTRFTEAWHAIRAEALAIARDIASVPQFHEVMPEQAPISAMDDRDWRVFVLKAYGLEFRGNMERCPKLSSILSATPEVISATLSFLAPWKHIPRHEGPFRGIMRFHLGLSMPVVDNKPAAPLRIADHDYFISNGECLLWDDTFPHEVSNNSAHTRIALLLDVWRPDQPGDLAVLSRLIVRLVQLGIKVRRIQF